MSRSLRRLLPALLTAAGALLLVAAPALADPTATDAPESGWWYRPNTGLVDVSPPDVGDDQLLIEGSPEGATAIAALRTRIPAGSAEPTLTLRVSAEQSDRPPVILACQTGAAWSPAAGGPWDGAPPADCTDAATGVPSEAGYVFALDGLQFTDRLDIVLVPGTSDGAPFDGVNGSMFRIVAERPTAADIRAVADTASVQPTTTVRPEADGDGSGSFSFAPPTTRRSPSVTAPPTSNHFSSSDLGPTAVAAPAVPADQTGLTATAPIRQATTAAALPAAVSIPEDSDIPRLRLLGLSVFVVGVVTGFLWWRQDNALPLRSVVTGLTPEELEARLQVEPTVGGLARFRRERTGSAPQLF